MEFQKYLEKRQFICVHGACFVLRKNSENPSNDSGNSISQALCVKQTDKDTLVLRS